MSININDPEIQSILQNDTVEQHYSADCLPRKLSDPSTDKGNRCLYEEIDASIYDKEARMVAFRTTHNRIQPWIKVLNLYFYEIMGKESDKLITWVDNPDTISASQPLKSITIDIKNNKDERLYKVTFFVRSGLIQVQGNHHKDFENKDFPILLSIINQLKGSIHVSTPNDTHQGQLSVDVLTEQTEDTILKETAMQLPIDTDTNNNSSQKSVHDASVKCDTALTKSDLARLENVIADAILKLENGSSENTDKILKTIMSQSTSQESLMNITKNSDTIHTLEQKIHNLKEENKSLELQLKLEKGNSLLREEQQEKVIAHERELFRDSQLQQKKYIANLTQDQERYEKGSKKKNEEIDHLTECVTDLTSKLSKSNDEILQLKMNMSSLLDVSQHPTTASHTDDPRARPSVLLIGTSNIEGITAEKLTHVANVQKEIKYTIQDTANYISTLSTPPTVIVLHSLTNDLKHKKPQQCIDDLFQLTSTICAKWHEIKIVISFTTPRCDSMNNSTNGQIINALLKQKFAGVDGIYFAEHINMLQFGNPNKELLCEDGYHLNDKGITILAGNIKRAIHIALNVPLPPRRSGSAGRSRSRTWKGRGRGHVRA